MTPGPGTRITYREAVKQAIREALHADPRVFLMGEDVGQYGGCFAVSKGLLDEFGEERIRDTPLSESAFVGAGIGAALAGMRPIVEIMTVNFSLLALDQIVNNAATLCHMSGGQFPVPVVIRMATGAGRQLAAQHSHSLEAWYAHVPGLRVVAPATIDDARGMLRAALAVPGPGDHLRADLALQHGGRADRGGRDASTSSHARVHRPGRDVTLVTYGASLWRCVTAAEELAASGIEAEIVDLRIAASARRRDDPRLGAQDAARRDRRRGLAHRQPLGRGGDAHRRAGVLRSRCADRPRVHRGGADPVPEAPRGCGAAGPGADRGRRAEDDRRCSVNSACPRSARTWRRARSCSGTSRPATR